jgi:multidrug efflux pump
MSLSSPFIARPVATTLLTIAIALAGIFAYAKLPVSPLPQVDFPTISVRASQPGASPDIMGTSVAAPLERHLGQIADVTEMTSASSVGTTRVTLQFGLDRDINGAARDVEAAIQAARADLPTSLRSNPTYNKVNPSDAPILILALTSETLTQGQLYDAASNVFQQRLSQLAGVGEVDVGGSALPAVRVELNPGALFHYGIGLEDVRAALASANANAPKGSIEDGSLHYQLYTNDQATKAADYQPLVIAYRNNAAVHLTDLGQVTDSVEDLRNAGLANGKPAVLVIIFRQPGANIIQTVDGIRALLPQLTAALPGSIDVSIGIDLTTTIRASLNDTQRTLLIAVALVVMVVFVFLRDWRATLIPSVAVPISIIGTFAGMYLFGYSLDNLSLMALTIATGFVVDDAVVVLENISRHIEDGMPRMQAALVGAREVGFTVLSISASLIAVFLPILLMGGIVGRLFREFAVTLSMAIVVSLAISLTTTPMLCARILRPQGARAHGRLYRFSESVFDGMLHFYERTLTWALRHARFVALVLLATVGLNIYLFVIVPKGFFPQEDTGRMMGMIQADQSISFQLMKQKFTQFENIIGQDPAVESVVGFTGGRQTNQGNVYVSLKPLAQRHISGDMVIARLRPKLARVAGARLYLQMAQDIRVGGRQSNAQYQYTLQADDAATLYQWAPKLTAALAKSPVLADVNSDQQQKGLETDLSIDRATAARFGLTESSIDNTLYDAFGQRQVSTIYNALNQYHVVMEVAPRYWQSPVTLKQIYVSTSGATASGTQSTQLPAGTVTSSASTAAQQSASTASSAGSATGTGNSGASGSSATANADSARNAAINAIASSGNSSASSGASVSTASETMVPLAAFSSYKPGTTPLGVNHQGAFVAATISFNLPPGKSLSDATAVIKQAEADIKMPESIHGTFAGTAATFQSSLDNEPVLIAAALAAVYIVLGVLYESYVHPLTILSTLPSAGVGAVLALIIFHSQFTIIALIGVILLIGIVKKNAIMMIDFAIQAERAGATPRDAIFQACLLRFRPIMMTTAAAMLGALPLAFGTGEGAELRTPLGISIVGGLLVSQVLTLYTTPVVYLYLDALGDWGRRQYARLGMPPPPRPLPGAAE